MHAVLELLEPRILSVGGMGGYEVYGLSGSVRRMEPRTKGQTTLLTSLEAGKVGEIDKATFYRNIALNMLGCRITELITSLQLAVIGIFFCGCHSAV